MTQGQDLDIPLAGAHREHTPGSEGLGDREIRKAHEHERRSCRIGTPSAQEGPDRHGRNIRHPQVALDDPVALAGLVQRVAAAALRGGADEPEKSSGCARDPVPTVGHMAVTASSTAGVPSGRPTPDRDVDRALWVHLRRAACAASSKPRASRSSTNSTTSTPSGGRSGDSWPPLSWADDILGRRTAEVRSIGGPGRRPLCDSGSSFPCPPGGIGKPTRAGGAVERAPVRVRGTARRGRPRPRGQADSAASIMSAAEPAGPTGTCVRALGAQVAGWLGSGLHG